MEEETIAITILLPLPRPSSSPAEQKGQSPLHLAAHNGHVSVVELLLEAGADMAETTSDVRRTKPQPRLRTLL